MDPNSDDEHDIKALIEEYNAEELSCLAKC